MSWSWLDVKSIVWSVFLLCVLEVMVVGQPQKCEFLPIKYCLIHQQSISVWHFVRAKTWLCWCLMMCK